MTVQTENNKVCTITTSQQYSCVQLEHARSVSSLLYGTKQKNLQKLVIIEPVHMAKSQPRKNQSEQLDLG